MDMKPTADLEAARADLSEYGLCLIAGGLGPDALNGVRDRLYEIADADPDAGRGYVYDNDLTNQRVWCLLRYGKVFADLATDPTALDLVRRLLGSRLLLSSLTANITSPGGGEMVVHTDQGYLPHPWPEFPLVANAIWMIDEFRADNGATMVAPGSHRLGYGPQHLDAGESPPELVPLEGPAGTLCVMDGRIWHHTGVNCSDGDRRAGLFSYYTKPHIRSQEDWQRSLSVQQLAEADKDPVLADLLGLRSWHSLGLVNGAEV
jgi:ectoine hydroxylase-related dioxygenase (phytanoyl-CoA dioxygenase family)